ncbi:hypothetical protein AAFF_G00110380 [Aldrovandia affinis]|uniref:Uncharacterized protein n=1 Tax=Aldrovandia affinis TaxID=143900 RepID=A0AAD7WBT5_9TELE|nr:hypothetical protein AAFF_G00110380 [Aldrovandia affinis]
MFPSPQVAPPLHVSCFPTLTADWPPSFIPVEWIGVRVCGGNIMMVSDMSPGFGAPRRGSNRSRSTLLSSLHHYGLSKGGQLVVESLVQLLHLLLPLHQAPAELVALKL